MLDECGVAGVMRRAFRQWAAERGKAIAERPIAADELEAAPSLVLTNALIGAWPVRELAGRALARGPDCRGVQRMARTRVSRALPWSLRSPSLSRSAAWLGWRQYERHWLLAPIAALQAPVTFDVPPGASLRAVAGALGQAGPDGAAAHLAPLRRPPKAWRRSIQAGEYRLVPGTTPAMLLDQFVAGRRRPARA